MLGEAAGRLADVSPPPSPRHCNAADACGHAADPALQGLSVSVLSPHCQANEDDKLVDDFGATLGISKKHHVRQKNHCNICFFAICHILERRTALECHPIELPFM